MWRLPHNDHNANWIIVCVWRGKHGTIGDRWQIGFSNTKKSKNKL